MPKILPNALVSTEWLSQHLGDSNLRVFDCEEYILQSLRSAYDLGLEQDIANHLFEFARVRVAQGRPKQAAELLILLLEQPVSQQARFERGRIRDNARELLARLEIDLSPETYASVLRQGKKMALDEVLSKLLS